MKRHLEKYKKCEIKNKYNTLSEDELYKKSLIKNTVYKIKKNEKQIDNKKIDNNNDSYCYKCEKKFYHKSNLNKHLKRNICNKKDNLKKIKKEYTENIKKESSSKIYNIYCIEQQI